MLKYPFSPLKKIVRLNEWIPKVLKTLKHVIEEKIEQMEHLSCTESGGPFMYFIFIQPHEQVLILMFLYFLTN